MNLDISRLASQRTIDLTTRGRHSGLDRRIEIWWFLIDNRFVITGSPGRRDWMANARAHPEVVIHAGGHDLDATATEITEEAERRRVFTDPQTSWYTTQAELDRLVEESPMVEIQLKPR